MKKIKQWIKTWLGVAALEERNNELEERIRVMQIDKIRQMAQVDTLTEKYIDHAKQVAVLTNVVKVGVDVNESRFGSRSWAVICLEGKADYVQFVDMDTETIRGIANFLRAFEPRNCIVDLPFAVKKPDFFKL